MKKKLIVLAIALMMVFLLAGCACEHEWVEATCLTPKTCSKCEEVEGEALGHTWVDADCETPKTCSVCAATEGEALGHTWVDATCETPKTCSVCAATEGEALGHTWVEATCEAPKTCSVCAATEGEALGHTLEEQWTVGETALVKNCTVCGKAGETKELVATDGTALKPVMLNESLVYVVPDGMTEEEISLNVPSNLWVDMEKGWGMVASVENAGEDFTLEMALENLSANPNIKDVTLNENQNGEKYISYYMIDDTMHNFYFFGTNGNIYQLMFLKCDPQAAEDEGKSFLQMPPVYIFDDGDFVQIIYDIVNNVFVVR